MGDKRPIAQLCQRPGHGLRQVIDVIIPMQDGNASIFFHQR
jgi:hypothetical protein